MSVKEEEGTSSRGADWEVVSLSASAYAAAPGAQPFEPTDENKQAENVTKTESPAALFMSGHFVFPPGEHENLPLLQEMSEIHSEQGRHKESTGVVEVDEGIDNSSKEKFQSESKDSIHSNERTTIVGDVGFGEVRDPYSDTETVLRGTQYEIEEPLCDPKDHTKTDEDDLDGSGLPCQAWWNKHVASLYQQARQANAFWSVVAAATVLGIIVLGQRWQRDKWQFHQLKWRFSRG